MGGLGDWGGEKLILNIAKLFHQSIAVNGSFLRVLPRLIKINLKIQLQSTSAPWSYGNAQLKIGPKTIDY